VCADQAFFATELGKSIGVPTAYTTGKSAEAGHAWVGFVQAASDRVFWNFDQGRYPEYKGVKGEVLDPQMRVRIPDAFVSLLAELLGTTQKPVKAADRQAAEAFTDAAVRVGEMDGVPFKPAAIEPKLSDARSAARTAGIDGSLELLKMAVLQNKGYPRPWFAVRKLTLDGKLSMAQKKEWRDAVLNVCGAKYPDFALALLEPIITTVEDPAQQNQWWDTAFAMFQNRWDLAASIRMHQAKLWEDQKQPAKAGQYYEDVINRYTNAGPFVLEALAAAEKLLEGKPDKILKLYEQTFARATKPEPSAFADQSNWYNIGQQYVTKLRAAGQTAKADKVLGELRTAAP
jgi:tetratricopeptide (TPR) repeat protein